MKDLRLLKWAVWVMLFGVDQRHNISVKEGETINLSANFSKDTGIKKCTFDCQRTDEGFNSSNSYVHSYRGTSTEYSENIEPQLPRYENRTKLMREDLFKGVLNLQIISAKQSDSGNYACYFPELNKNITFRVHVAPRDSAPESSQECNFLHKVGVPKEWCSYTFAAAAAILGLIVIATVIATAIVIAISIVIAIFKVVAYVRKRNSTDAEAKPAAEEVEMLRQGA